MISYLLDEALVTIFNLYGQLSHLFIYHNYLRIAPIRVLYATIIPEKLSFFISIFFWLFRICSR